MSNFQQVLSQALMSGQILTNEPMSRHTTFRVGGPADYFAKVETEAELAGILALCGQWEMPYYAHEN